MSSILKPAKENILASCVVSLALIVLSLTVPSLGFQAVFLGKALSGQILYLVSNLFFCLVVYYPLACGLVYVFKIVTKKEKATRQRLVMSLFFIFILNPLTLSFVISKIVESTRTTHEQLCGLQILEVTAPSAIQAGLVVGEVITAVNNSPIDTMESLRRALTHSKTDDTVTVVTNTTTHNVPVFANPQNPQQVLLGIKVNPTECGDR